jgi:NADH-quinone oxidoreductase subunit N
MVKSIPLVPTAVERANRLFSGDVLVIYDHSLVLNEGIRELFLFVYLGSSVLFLMSLAFPQGRYFVPGALAVLSPLAAALMIESLSLGPLLLLISVTILVVIIQSERPGSTRAALRFLVIAVIAVPLLLVAGWMLTGEQTALLVTTSRLLLGGITLLLAGFPFFIWVRPVVSEAPPLVSVFMFGLVQSVTMVLIFKLLWANPWLQQDEMFVRLLFFSGAGTVLTAGILTMTSFDVKSLLGSSLLLDMGMIVLALAMGGADGWKIAMTLQTARFFSLLVAMVGHSVLKRRNGYTAMDASSGLARRSPLGAALFMFGCVSLIGLPLTVGFSGRWAMIVAVENALEPSWLPYLMLLAMIGGTIGILRCLAVMLTRTDDETAVPALQAPWLRGLSALTLIVGLWLAVFPRTLHEYADRLADLLL